MGLQINYLYVKSVTSEQYCADGCMRIIYILYIFWQSTYWCLEYLCERSDHQVSEACIFLPWNGEQKHIVH